jgi:hypothetical protein
MAELTQTQATVLNIVREQCRLGNPVSAGIVRDRAWTWHSKPQISYDMANRALTTLVAKGLLTKPTRGWYLPVATNQEDRDA